MVRCTFCENVIKPGTGKMYVKTDGRIFYFCSRKCEQNLLKLHRKPAAHKWTKAFNKFKGGKK